MMPKPAHKSNLLRLFQPKVDFFALLDEQAAETTDGLRGLHNWLVAGGKGECTVMHELEHKADAQKRKIQESLRDNFVTPIDGEDIYDVSAQLDLVINNGKKLVKDIEIFDGDFNDEYTIKMSELILEGAERVQGAIRNLHGDLLESADLANKARKTESHVGNVRRKAMKALFDAHDIEGVVMRDQIYHRMLRVAECLEQLGERLLHISIKLG